MSIMTNIKVILLFTLPGSVYAWGNKVPWFCSSWSRSAKTEQASSKPAECRQGADNEHAWQREEGPSELYCAAWDMQRELKCQSRQVVSDTYQQQESLRAPISVLGTTGKFSSGQSCKVPGDYTFRV